MAFAYISEYSAFGFPDAGSNFPVPNEQAHIGDQRVTFTTSAQSNAFDARTKMISIILDTKGHVVFGDNPTAVATNKYLPADEMRFFRVKAGSKVAIYDGTS